MNTVGCVFSYLLLATASLVQVLLAPSKLSNLQVVSFNQGASIHLSRSAPPVAALEDIADDVNTYIAEEKFEPKEEVRLGSSVQSQLIEYIHAAPARVISLEGTTLEKTAEEVVALVSEYKAPKAESKSSTYTAQPAGPSQTTTSAAGSANPASKQILPNPSPKNLPSVDTYGIDIPVQTKTTQISGHIELAGGLAFLGGDQSLSVSRVVNDEYYEPAEINMSEGKFNIKVADLQGKLVAELLDPDNNVIGHGEFQLDKIKDKNQAKISGITIKLYAALNGVFGRTLSAYSFEEKEIPVPNAKISTYEMDVEATTDENGHFNLEGTDRDSILLVSAKAPKFWPTVTLVSGGQSNEIKMFPEEMVEALINIVGKKMDQIEWRKAPILWGQVKSLGKPLAGAKVELAGISGQPIYFNKLFLPDTKQETTGDNGYFVYLGVTPGTYQLRATYGNRVIDGNVVQLFAGTLSFIELKVPEVINASEFRMHDLFDPNSDLRGEIRVLGTESIVDPQKDTLDFDYGKSMIFLEAITDRPYSPSRMATKPRAQVSIPMVSEDWLAQIVSTSKELRDPEKGTVIITFEEPIDEVFVNGQAISQNKKNVIYFDKNGKAHNSFKEIKDGGVLLFNIPVGLQNIAVKPAHQDKIKTNLVISDSGIINVFSTGAPVNE